MWHRKCCPFQQQIAINIADRIVSRSIGDSWTGFEAVRRLLPTAIEGCGLESCPSYASPQIGAFESEGSVGRCGPACIGQARHKRAGRKMRTVTCAILAKA